MKIYEKPKIKCNVFHAYEQMSSLNEWLNSNGLTDAGITTYVINS